MKNKPTSRSSISTTYDFQKVEKKWIAHWDKTKIFDSKIDPVKKKFYVLDTFVYPSGKGVTIGHYKSFGGMDVQARYMRMKGYNVLYPTGWDTFGMPAENFAIKSGRHPKDITNENRENFRQQYKAAGLSYAWNAEIDTSDPEYYKWTQWVFIQLYKKGLAYKKKSFVNWCPKDMTVIAKEQIVNGDECERCGSKVEQKELEQWFFKVSDYAKRLFEDCSKLNWPKECINPHRNWIGKYDEDGKFVANVRDWCISRQRYWGPPIPIIYCKKCGEVPAAEKDLPVMLPYTVDFTPTGKSPLAKDEDFVNVTCPNCGSKAKRETDTMDTFVSSAWYQFRFTDPHNNVEFASQENVKHWMPVDIYAGTVEHLTAHLIYARFITKVLFDCGFVPFDEPFIHYVAVGLLVDKTGTRFSKRLGNAPETNELIEKYGGDLLRMSCQFISSYGDISKWSEQDVVAVKRFRDRIWGLFTERVLETPYGETFVREDCKDKISELIREVEENTKSLKYNVALSKLMVFLKYLHSQEKNIHTDIWEVFTKLLAQFAPFIAEEMWDRIGKKGSVHSSNYPVK